MCNKLVRYSVHSRRIRMVGVGWVILNQSRECQLFDFGESTAESTNQNPTNDDRGVPAIDGDSDDGLILEQEGEDDEADIIPTECMLANFFPRSISLVDYPTSVAAGGDGSAHHRHVMHPSLCHQAFIIKRDWC